MFVIRDTKPQSLMSHKMATVAVRRSLTVCGTRMLDLVIVAGWKKEAAP